MPHGVEGVSVLVGAKPNEVGDEHAHLAREVAQFEPRQVVVAQVAVESNV